MRADGLQRQLVGIVHYRHYQPFVKCHRHTNVDPRKQGDTIRGHLAVDPRVLS